MLSTKQNTESKRRRRTSAINQLRHEDRAAHDWYRFVLSFPPHLVQVYLQQFGVSSSNQVLDPFCGTGTTLVECKKLGVPSVGVEANPMAHFASQVKVDWSPDPDSLIDHAYQVAETLKAEFDLEGILEGASNSFLEKQPQLRTLPDESQNLLLKNSISPLPLHKTLALLSQLKKHPNKQCERHEQVALAKALVDSISNLRFRPEVGVGPTRLNPPVIEAWLSEVREIANDLRELKSITSAPAIAHHADSRQILKVLEPNSIDAVITSPPYPNEKDYTRTTRLELVLLGFITSKAELQALKRGLIRSNTRGVYKGDDDDQWITAHPEIQRIAAEIEARRIALGKTSGFEKLYGKVTKLYFGGMARHLADLRTILRPGAQLAYVVGDQASYLQIMLRTGQLLVSIAQSLGYELIRIDLFRTRIASATQEQLREEVVVLRWPGQTHR